jgi:fucose 4-O-acetylase-like acetyltransferase
LILLVIAGHVLRRKEFVNIQECIFAWEWIYIFHMPLFIFLSGYFSSKKSERKIFYKSIWKIAEPLIIIQLITKTAGVIIKGRFSLISFLSPWEEMWYLLCLVYWRTILQVIPDKVLKKSKLIIAITFCISMISGFFPLGYFLELQRALSLMPFFFLGYYTKGKSIFLPSKYKPLCLTLLVLSLFIPVIFPQYVQDLSHCSQYDSVYRMFYRTFVFIISIPISIAFINTCPHSHLLARHGRLTLQYYIYHYFLMIFIMMIINKLNVEMSILTVIVVILVIIIGLGIASYMPYFKNLTNPSSLLKE